MGELFKAMALLKGSTTRDLRLPGFRGIDLSRTL
jgi:hypothetical protein